MKINENKIDPDERNTVTDQDVGLRTMTKNKVKLLLVIPSIAWASFGLCHLMNGYTFNDSVSEIKWLALGLVLFLFALLGCIFKRTRWVAILSLLIIVAIGITEKSLRSHRLTVGIQQLEAIYHNIATKGPPFSQSIDRSSYKNPAFLHWYYQKNSEQSFAIVYIVSSDGWTMEYPGVTWRFIGYYPDGYEPNKEDTSNSDSATAKSE